MERINNCQSVMYVRTPASFSSAWAAWELGYAHALGKKIYVLQFENVKEIPAFLDIYDQTVIRGESIIAYSNRSQTSIRTWLAA